MKIYTVAVETNECYGHGDFGKEQRITRNGAYGTGEFPPAYKTREGAQKYLESLKRRHDKVVVELELVD